MVHHIYCTLLTRTTVAEPQEKGTSITVDSDSGEVSESGSSSGSDDSNPEASDSDEEDIVPDLPSHVGHSETEKMQTEEQSLPSPLNFPPNVCKSSFSLGLCRCCVDHCHQALAPSPPGQFLFLSPTKQSLPWRPFQPITVDDHEGHHKCCLLTYQRAFKGPSFDRV
jgi:hypothetical protein